MLLVIKTVVLFVLIFLLSPTIFFLLTKFFGKYFKLELHPDSLAASMITKLSRIFSK